MIIAVPYFPIQIDACKSNSFVISIGRNSTLQNPTNLHDGMVLNFVFKQEGSFDLNFGSMYLFPGGVAPTLTTGSGAIDFMSCYYDEDSSSIISVMNQGFA